MFGIDWELLLGLKKFALSRPTLFLRIWKKKFLLLQKNTDFNFQNSTKKLLFFFQKFHILIWTKQSFQLLLSACRPISNLF